MSLINSMLKDLENRNQSTTRIPMIGLTNPKETSKQSYTLYLALAGITIASMALTSFILTTKTDEKEALLPPLAAVAKSSQSIANQNPTWVQPVDITNMAINQVDDATAITIALSHAALYAVFNDTKANTVSIIFYNSTFKSIVPGVDPYTTAVNDIRTINENGDTKIQFKMAKGASVRDVHLATVNAQPQLVILLNPAPKAAPLQTQNTIVKSPANTSSLSAAMQAVTTAIETKDYDKAKGLLSRLLISYPTDQTARTTLVTLLINEKHYKEAISLLDQGLHLDTNWPGFIELKARIFALQGNQKAALQVLSTTAPSLEDHTSYYALMAAMSESLHQYKNAVEIYRQLLNVDSQNAQWWLGFGVSLDKNHQTSDAAYAYERALKSGSISFSTAQFIRNRLQTLREENNA